MIRGVLQVLTLLLILCLCNGNAQTRAASAPSLSATPSDEKPGVKIQHVSFATEDGGLIYADLYGEGDQGVVLAHGGRFTKESWQSQAQQLARAGFHVLAFDFRGFGQSHGPGDSDMDTAPMWLDVLAAVRYLRKNGAKTVAIVGAVSAAVRRRTPQLPHNPAKSTDWCCSRQIGMVLRNESRCPC